MEKQSERDQWKVDRIWCGWRRAAPLNSSACQRVNKLQRWPMQTSRLKCWGENVQQSSTTLLQCTKNTFTIQKDAKYLKHLTCDFMFALENWCCIPAGRLHIGILESTWLVNPWVLDRKTLSEVLEGLLNGSLFHIERNPHMFSFTEETKRMPELWIFKKISTLALHIKSKREAEPGYASKVIYSTRLLIKTSLITLVIQILTHKKYNNRLSFKDQNDIQHNSDCVEQKSYIVKGVRVAQWESFAVTSEIA